MARLLFLVVFFSFIFSQGRLDGLVAIVGKNMVLYSDVFQQSQMVAISQRVDPIKRPYLFEDIYIRTFDNIINQYAVLDVAEKDTLLVLSEDEVDRVLDQRLNTFIDQAGSKKLFEEAVGMPLRQIKLDYWQEIRNMMLIERYKFSKIQHVDVSRVEVGSFYDNYMDSIPMVPENYTFSVIEVPFSPGASSERQVYNMLDSLRSLIVIDGASFDSLAKIHSKDPGSAASGGRLGFTERGTLVQEYEEAAFALGPGEVSLPIRSQFGYHLIHLIDKMGEKISSQHILLPISFSSEDRALAHEEAMSIYYQTNNDPFLFDSLAVEYNNKHNNTSGTYSGLLSKEIPLSLLDPLGGLLENKLSPPINISSGLILVYLYKYNKEYKPSPSNAWNLIYQYARENKQNHVFQKIVSSIKDRTFIKTFN